MVVKHKINDNGAARNGARQKTRLVSVFESLRLQGWQPGHGGGWSDDLTSSNYRAICAEQMKLENLPLVCVAIELLAKHQPDTVRGVMYNVVSAGFLPDTSQESYGRIQRLLNKGRKRGLIPFEWIVDNIRSTIKPSSWSGLADFADTVQRSYRKDFWAQLPEYVEVIVEKDTVAGRIATVTREFDVRLHPLRGYVSTSFAHEIASLWKQIEKPITVYYIGDHDPSGRDIERSVIESLREYSGRQFTWKRLGVEPSHFEQFNIIPLEPKKKDKRYQKFVDQYGPRCAEVEAIPASDLRDMVRAAITSHIPTDRWEKLQAIELQEKEQWLRVMNAMKGAA
jgi:hypothetical protein